MRTGEEKVLREGNNTCDMKNSGGVGDRKATRREGRKTVEGEWVSDQQEHTYAIMKSTTLYFNFKKAKQRKIYPNTEK